MSESFSQRDTMKLDRGFERIEKSADITNAEQQRILSSVMRKAGIEMNDSKKKENIKVSRGFKGFGMIAAAAAAVAIGISAVTLSGRINDEESKIDTADTPKTATSTDGGDRQMYADIDTLYGDGYYQYFLDNYEAYTEYGRDQQEAKDKEFLITADCVISDGHFANVRVCTEGLTEQAKKSLGAEFEAKDISDRSAYPENAWVRLFYADDKTFITTDTEINTMYADGIRYGYVEIPLDEIDTDREVLLQLCENYTSDGTEIKWDSEDSEKLNYGNVYVKLSLDYTALPKPFTEKGGKKKLELSPIGVKNEEYSDRESVKIFDSGDSDDPTVIMTLEYIDGSTKDIAIKDIGDIKTFGYLGFKTVMPDYDQVTAVTINGSRYLSDYSELSTHFSSINTYIEDKSDDVTFSVSASDEYGVSFLEENKGNIVPYIRMFSKDGGHTASFEIPKGKIETTANDDGEPTLEVTLNAGDFLKNFDGYLTDYFETAWYLDDDAIADKKQSGEDWLDDIADREHILNFVKTSQVIADDRLFINGQTFLDITPDGISSILFSGLNDNGGYIIDDMTAADDDTFIASVEYKDGTKTEILRKDLGVIKQEYISFKDITIEPDKIAYVTIFGHTYDTNGKRV